VKKEYIVITPNGHDYGRDESLADCIAAAKQLGKGARVEELDDCLCKTGKVVYEA
jgi:hypothetical protein